MERSRVTLAALIYVLLFSQKIIYGAEIEMTVRPGDNITLICDRPLTRGSSITWIRNCSHKDQPSLIINHKTMNKNVLPRFRFLQNSNVNSLDLHITNIKGSDLGLYYCAEYERKLSIDKNGISYTSEEYYYGNQTTRLSLAETASCEPPRTVSPPVSDHSLCWTLLFSVCPVCVLFSSICVYCLCQKKTTGSEENSEMPTVNVLKVDQTKKHLSEMSKIEKFNLYSEVTYRLLPSDHPQNRTLNLLFIQILISTIVNAYYTPVYLTYELSQGLSKHIWVQKLKTNHTQL